MSWVISSWIMSSSSSQRVLKKNLYLLRMRVRLRSFFEKKFLRTDIVLFLEENLWTASELLDFFLESLFDTEHLHHKMNKQQLLYVLIGIVMLEAEVIMAVVHFVVVENSWRVMEVELWSFFVAMVAAADIVLIC